MALQGKWFLPTFQWTPTEYFLCIPDDLDQISIFWNEIRSVFTETILSCFSYKERDKWSIKMKAFSNGLYRNVISSAWRNWYDKLTFSGQSMMDEDYVCSCIIYVYVHRVTRGLWTAMPALIKVKETGQINQHFYVEKILKRCTFAGKSKMCVHSYSFLAQKALFLPPL